MPWSRIAECIVVDNGSTDGTGEIAAAAGARVVKSPRGYGHAMAAGIAAAEASSDVFLFLDGDGADPVEEWERVVGPVARGEADLVLASRLMGTREAGSMLGSQVFAGHLIGWMVRLLYGHRYTDMCAFRAIPRDTVERMGMREMTFGWKPRNADQGREDGSAHHRGGRLITAAESAACRRYRATGKLR